MHLLTKRGLVGALFTNLLTHPAQDPPGPYQSALYRNSLTQFYDRLIANHAGHPFPNVAAETDS